MRLPALALLACLLLAGCATQPPTPTPAPSTPAVGAPSVEPTPPSETPASRPEESPTPEVPAEEPPPAPEPPREPLAPWSRTIFLEGMPLEVAAGTEGKIASLASAGNWRGNATLQLLDASTGATLWSAPLEPAWWRSLVLWGDWAFVSGTTPPGADRTAYVEARDLRTGARLWRAEEPVDVGSVDGLATDGTRVYVALSDMRGDRDAVVAYSAETGARLWARNTTSPAGQSHGGGHVQVSPDGALLLRLATGIDSYNWRSFRLVAHTTATGEVAWEVPGETRSRALPILAVGTEEAFLATTEEAEHGTPGALVVLQVGLREGRVVSTWRHRALDDLLVMPKSLALDEQNATLYAATWRERSRGSFVPTLLAFDTLRGALRWDVEPGRNLGDPALVRAGGRILFGGIETVGGERGGGTKALALVAYDPAGPVLGSWSAPPLESIATRRLLVLDGRVLMASGGSSGYGHDLHLHSFDLASILDPGHLERRG